MKWFEKKETEISGSWMLAPYNNIFIGSDPRDGATKKWATQFDAIVNVSCTPGALFEPAFPEQRTYWYPLNECSQWSYAYFFMMWKIIDHHYRKGDKIYIHCHAGAYRSPSIFRTWLMACERKSLQEANEIERNRDWGDDESMKHYSIYQNYLLGNMPPKFQEFVERVRHEGIEKAQFVAILWNPTRLDDDPQVRTKRSYQDWLWNLKYNLKKPWRMIENAYKRTKELYRLWKNDLIEIKPTRGYTITTNDWEKGAKKRPRKKKT